MYAYHEPVLVAEVIEGLAVEPDRWYIDATTGDGGHTSRILERGGKVLALDRDREALDRARERLAEYEDRVIFVYTQFSRLAETVEDQELDRVAGILFDLGASSLQFEKPERGFSFQQEAELDMRMDRSLAVTAADLINELGKDELIKLFNKLGEERHARRIAEAVVRRRRVESIQKTTELAELIEEEVGWPRDSIHPATRVFQALRIAVNDELNELKTALPIAVELLEAGGRLAVISFHSLEDRIVKHVMRDEERLREIRKKPITPSEAEISENPKSRSAKLRIGERK